MLIECVLGAGWVLIGACNPMSCSIHVIKVLELIHCNGSRLGDNNSGSIPPASTTIRPADVTIERCAGLGSACLSTVYCHCIATVWGHCFVTVLSLLGPTACPQALVLLLLQSDVGSRVCTAGSMCRTNSIFSDCGDEHVDCRANGDLTVFILDLGLFLSGCQT